MKGRVILIMALVIGTGVFNVCSAQTDKDTISQKGISVSYWGPLMGSWWSQEDVPWGARLGYENSLLNTQKYNILCRSSLIYQQMNDKYIAGGITISSVLQRIFKFGLYIEQSVLAGYMGSRYNFDVYKTTSDGEIVNVGKKLFSSAIYGYGVGLGYDFSKVTNADIKVFFNPILYNKVPNNDNPFLLYNYSFDLGLVMNMSAIQKKNSQTH